MTTMVVKVLWALCTLRLVWVKAIFVWSVLKIGQWFVLHNVHTGEVISHVARADLCTQRGGHVCACVCVGGERGESGGEGKVCVLSD